MQQEPEFEKKRNDPPKVTPKQVTGHLPTFGILNGNMVSVDVSMPDLKKDNPAPPEGEKVTLTMTGVIGSSPCDVWYKLMNDVGIFTEAQEDCSWDDTVNLTHEGCDDGAYFGCYIVNSPAPSPSTPSLLSIVCTTNDFDGTPTVLEPVPGVVATSAMGAPNTTRLYYLWHDEATNGVLYRTVVLDAAPLFKGVDNTFPLAMDQFTLGKIADGSKIGVGGHGFLGCGATDDPVYLVVTYHPNLPNETTLKFKITGGRDGAAFKFGHFDADKIVPNSIASIPDGQGGPINYTRDTPAPAPPG